MPSCLANTSLDAIFVDVINIYNHLALEEIILANMGRPHPTG